MEENNKKKNSFSENAKGFLGAWKDDFAKKNKDILDRAKKRREENQKLNEQIKSLWTDIQSEFQGTAKDLYEKVNIQFQGFMQAAKEGTATVAQKLELEGSIEQMKAFLQASHDKGEAEFSKMANSIKESLKNLNIESTNSEHQDIKGQAEKQVTKDNLEKLDDIQKKANDLNDLFDEEK